MTKKIYTECMVNKSPAITAAEPLTCGNAADYAAASAKLSSPEAESEEEAASLAKELTSG